MLLYINDLRAPVKLYADDVLLYATINCYTDCVALQNDLKLLQKWAVDWEIQFNFTKCEFLRVTKRKNPILATYTIGGSVIQEASYVKYLGVTIDSQLSWNDHI